MHRQPFRRPLTIPSMNMLRLLLVSRRFWPLAGERETLAGNLARQLAEWGHQVTVASAALVKQWPGQFQLDSIQVRRIPLATRRIWSGPTRSQTTSRWARGLQRWLINHQSRFDAVIAFEFTDDLGEVSRILAQFQMPVLIRVDVAATTALEHSSQRATPRPPTPDWVGIVVSSEPQLDWAAKGYFGAAIQVIPDGIQPPADGAPTRAESRQMLADAHQLLSLEPSQPLAVCVEPLTHRNELDELIRNWRHILASHPDARLWLVGCGDSERELYHRVNDLGLASSIIFPGEFDEIQDVLSAANMFIIPGLQNDGAGIFALTACQQGLPIVCHQDSMAARQLAWYSNLFLYEQMGRNFAETINHALQAGLVTTDDSNASLPSLEHMASGYLAALEPLMKSQGVKINQTKMG